MSNALSKVMGDALVRRTTRSHGVLRDIAATLKNLIDTRVEQIDPDDDTVAHDAHEALDRLRDVERQLRRYR